VAKEFAQAIASGTSSATLILMNVGFSSAGQRLLRETARSAGGKIQLILDISEKHLIQ